MEDLEELCKKLQKEKVNLLCNIDKLADFIYRRSPFVSNIDSMDMILLDVQLNAMKTYNECLSARIIHIQEKILKKKGE